MSIRSKIATVAVMLTIVAGVSAAATQPANAETHSCDLGGPACIEISSAAFGTGYILDVVNNSLDVGAPVTLAAASPTNKGEDFIPGDGQPVNVWIQAGLISPGMGPRWGKLYAFEIQYAPFGAPNGTCVGLADPAILATITMQPCGASAKTLWIYDPLGTAANSPGALISGATTAGFNDPLALTALLFPGVPLFAANLATPPLASQRWSGVQFVRLP